MTQRGLTLLALLALAACATPSPRSASLDRLVREHVVPRGTAVPECPIRIIPVPPKIVPMPAVRVDSTRQHSIRVIPPACTPTPA